MGQQELEAALRRDGDAKARDLWGLVETEAQRLRTDSAESLRQEELTENARQETVLFALTAALQSDAEQRARRVRLEAEAGLAQRLARLAGDLLEPLAVANREGLFQLLADEIPEHPWRQVRVNRRDRQLVGERFPEAEISLADEISAGLEVQSRDGRIMVINTLEKRLAHLWPELLPDLMAELRQMAGDDGSVA